MQLGSALPSPFGTHYKVALGSLATLLVTLAPQLAAQADPDSVKLRNDCRLAAQVLSIGRPAPHRQDALTVIGFCGSSGRQVIGNLWETGTLDSLEVQVLATSTRPLPSDILAQRLLRVAGTPSRPRVVRLGAICVLVTFIDPNLLVHPEDLTRTEHSLFSTVDHPEIQVGRELLTMPLRARLLELAQQLAADDPDPTMRIAWSHLARNLRLINEL